ncbi:stage II sporulation protein M [Desulfotomaculum defluvii]
MARTFKKLCKSSLRNSWPIYFLAFITLATGMFFGSLGVHALQVDTSGQLSQYLDDFVNKASNVIIDRPQVVKNTIFNNLLFIGIIYFLGLTVIGTPAILALLFARGYSLGFTVAFLTREKAGEGIILTLSSVAPQNILLIPAIFLASVAALSFSWLLIKRFGNSKLPVMSGLIGYHVLMLIVCSISAAAGLVEAFITPELIKAAANFIKM